MKTKNILALAALGFWGLSACSTNEKLPQYGQEATFSATVSQIQGRASHAATGNCYIQNFGVAVQDAVGKNRYNYNNIKYQAEKLPAQNWTPAQVLQWYPNTHTVNILAYSPWKEGLEDLFTMSSLPVEVESTQTTSSYQSDLLVCKMNGHDPKVHPDVTLNFKHALSQVVIKLTMDGVSDATLKELKNVTLEGTVLNATYNLTDETVTLVQEAPSAISIEKNATEAQPLCFTAVIIPQTVAQGKLSVTFYLNGWKYYWVSNKEYTFNANTSYDLNIKVTEQNTQPQIQMTSRAWSVNR